MGDDHAAAIATTANRQTTARRLQTRFEIDIDSPFRTLVPCGPTTFASRWPHSKLYPDRAGFWNGSGGGGLPRSRVIALPRGRAIVAA
jgi:hypothetical protein